MEYRPRGADAPELLVNPCGKALVGRAKIPGPSLIGDREIWVGLGNELLDSMREGWRLLAMIVVDREERVLLEWAPEALSAYVLVLERAHRAVLRHQQRAWRLQLLAHARQDVRGRTLAQLRVFAKELDAYLEERLEGEADRPVPSVLGPWPWPDGEQGSEAQFLDEWMDAPAEAFPLAVRWSWRRTQ